MARKQFNWADHECSRWCKVHYYWDFEMEDHFPLPNSYNIMTQAGWLRSTVFVGPPAWCPKKPTPDQWQQIRMVCLHTQKDLTCQTCHRHDFYPRVII